MGFVKAAVSAASGVMADQWKEFFACDALPAEESGKRRIGSFAESCIGSRRAGSLSASSPSQSASRPALPEGEPRMAAAKISCIFPASAVQYQTTIKDRGARVGGLRGSSRTSTLKPDADNAAVGSHSDMNFYRGHRKRCPLFLFALNFWREEHNKRFRGTVWPRRS